MRNNSFLAASAASAFLALLTACGSNERTSAQGDAALVDESPSIASAQADEEGEPKTQSPEASDVSTVASSSLVEIASENCTADLYELANRAETEITVLESASTPTGAAVSLMIDGAAAPWSCTTDESGNVTDLYYNAKEG